VERYVAIRTCRVVRGFADVRKSPDRSCDGIRAMTEREVSALLMPGEYLVCYELPRMSGLWGVLVAPSREAIRASYPELVIVVSLPTWMDEGELARMRETPLWLDEEPPQGLLRALVATRHHE
jgi:hypothetical protein